MKKYLLLLAFGLLAGGPAARAQTAYQVPTGYSFQAPADYARYDAQVIEAVNWLETTPLGKDDATRKQVNVFLLQWMTGTPAVSVQLQKYTSDLGSKDAVMLMVFMGGWSRYQLQNPESKDMAMMNLEGVKSVLKAYQAGGYQRNKKIEALAAMNEKGTLAEWLKSQVKG
ncbi:hypothetical protein LJY25_12935 [Hymenobacter sp. BT175]|uniref:hypothetical protein n=1 Tax=Hymenobacter translucens TaxID=2886507 RepID=UPI001D0EF7C7|nr:hypothetical protein [Hymenobacter translucens]MCC2547353.1 hypothetical protein [Hymenobacter translucens]